MAIFPENMTDSQLTIENIASKLTYFHEQIHLLHWQTQSYAEHKTLESLYEDIHSFKDDVIEKLMGYMGKKPKAFKIEALKDGISCIIIVKQLAEFAKKLEDWSGEHGYSDIENMAQELSGKAAKTLYLLTLS